MSDDLWLCVLGSNTKMARYLYVSDPRSVVFLYTYVGLLTITTRTIPIVGGSVLESGLKTNEPSLASEAILTSKEALRLANRSGRVRRSTRVGF
jgi:hypothetical protein